MEEGEEKVSMCNSETFPVSNVNILSNSDCDCNQSSCGELGSAKFTVGLSDSKGLLQTKWSSDFSFKSHCKSFQYRRYSSQFIVSPTMPADLVVHNLLLHASDQRADSPFH